MTKKIKQSLAVSLLGFILFLSLSNNALALVFANATDSAFDTTLEEVTPPLGMQADIVLGAEKFLVSYAQYLVFLSKVELTEVEEQSYETLHVPIQICSTNLELTKTIYLALTAKADATPYKTDMITSLANFDYTNFRNQEGLNATLFTEVELLLKSGNIREVYHRLLQEITQIQEDVNSLKGIVQAGGFPPLTLLWNTCQQYGQTLMFGQYVARVFIEIKTN